MSDLSERQKRARDDTMRQYTEHLRRTGVAVPTERQVREAVEPAIRRADKVLEGEVKNPKKSR